LGNIWYANGMAYIVVFALKFAIKILPGLSIQVVVILSRPLNRLFETFELLFLVVSPSKARRMHSCMLKLYEYLVL
jgi:hypothetical protein